MSDESVSGVTASMDVGAYCRQVEAHLTKVNGGHLVRVVGPGFELVRRWAEEGIPLSVVYRGIELKAARHQVGASRRPLRIEFCDDDVRALFADWRRAVGVTGESVEPEAETVEPTSQPSAPFDRREATQALDRAIERLSRGAGRLDWPEGLREAVSARLVFLTETRAELKGKRGEARSRLLAQISDSETAFSAELRTAAPPSMVAEAGREAERELSTYRNRLSPEAWTKAVETAADRQLRERLGLPVS